MKKTSKKKISGQAFLVLVLFALILIITQYLLFLRILDRTPYASVSSTHNSEELLKFNSERLANFHVLFRQERDRFESLSEVIAGRIRHNFISRQIDPKIQRYFERTHKENPYLDHIILFNRQGRLLALSPFDSELKNNIYDYTVYNKAVRDHALRTKKTFIYYYLFDQAVITNRLEPSRISQPPFIKLDDISKFKYEDQISHGVFDYKRRSDAGRIAQMPYFIVNTPCTLDGNYWGWSGFTVSYTHYINRLKSNYPDQNTLPFIILSESGHLLYYPDEKSIGIFAGNDPIIREILHTDTFGPEVVMLETSQGPVIFKKDRGLYFICGPEHFSLDTESGYSIILPPLVYVFFVFEIFLIILLYLLFHQKIGSALAEYLKKYKDREDLSGNEIIQIGSILPDEGRSVAGDTCWWGCIIPERAAKILKEKKILLETSNRKVQGTAVFIKLHNLTSLLKTLKDVSAFMNEWAGWVYAGADRHSGFVQNQGYGSHLIYFGITDEDTFHGTNAYQFVLDLLARVREYNLKPGPDVNVGISMESGEFISGLYEYQDQNEIMITGEVMDLLPRIETIITDNVAVIGETLKSSGVIDQKFIKEEVTIRLRDLNKTVHLSVLKPE